jgi:hypothetical protein
MYLLKYYDDGGVTVKGPSFESRECANVEAEMRNGYLDAQGLHSFGVWVVVTAC